jgi:hypothetical protein
LSAQFDPKDGPTLIDNDMFLLDIFSPLIVVLNSDLHDASVGKADCIMKVTSKREAPCNEQAQLT